MIFRFCENQGKFWVKDICSMKMDFLEKQCNQTNTKDGGGGRIGQFSSKRNTIKQTHLLQLCVMVMIQQMSLDLMTWW